MKRAIDMQKSARKEFDAFSGVEREIGRGLLQTRSGPRFLPEYDSRS
jgi:hypothetical protein